MKRSSSENGRSKLARNLVVGAVSVALSLVLLEAALRSFFPAHRFKDKNSDCFWALRMKELLADRRWKDFRHIELDPELGWRMRASFGDEGYWTNSRGLRGTVEHTAEKGPGVTRIVVLGDSFTFGYGVDDDETYTARMDASGPSVEAINLGVNGYGTDQQLLFWEADGKGYEPDAVVLGYYVPDFHRNALHVREFPKPWFEPEGDGLALRGVPVPRPAAALRNHEERCEASLRTADLLGVALGKLRPAGAPAAFELKSTLTRRILRDLKASVESSGARLFLVVIPHNRYEDYPEHTGIVRSLVETSSDAGVPVLDLTAPLQERQATHPDVSLYGPNEHWTVEAHAFAAEKILAFLRAHEAL